MRKAASWALSLAIGLTLTVGCICEASEPLHIDRRIMLSPGHRVMPYSITRAPGGDLIVLGSNEQMDYRAWATRLAPNGEVRWEFLEGGPDGWDDRSTPGQRFYGAIAMPDQTTLLCGIKKIDRRSMIMLVRLAEDGSLLSEKLLPPVRENVVVSLSACRKWDEAIVLLGSVSGQPSGTGWMAKLDLNLSMQWTKFGGDYGNGDMDESGANLIVLGWNDQDFYVAKIAPDGEIIAKTMLSAGEHYLVHGSGSASAVRIVSMPPAFKHTEIQDFDGQLRGPMRTLRLYNVGVKKCLAFDDGTIAILGSRFEDSATAAVTQVYKDGSYKTFLVQPRNESPWYIDAVLTGKGSEIAAVRQIGLGQGIVDFLSFK
jgi:hypothetical protein